MQYSNTNIVVMVHGMKEMYLYQIYSVINIIICVFIIFSPINNALK